MHDKQIFTYFINSNIHDIMYLWLTIVLKELLRTYARIPLKKYLNDNPIFISVLHQKL